MSMGNWAFASDILVDFGLVGVGDERSREEWEGLILDPINLR